MPFYRSLGFMPVPATQPKKSTFVQGHLNVSVHSDFEICMTQQFLNDFRILAVGVQDGAERMTKRMPNRYAWLARSVAS